MDNLGSPRGGRSPGTPSSRSSPRLAVKAVDSAKKKADNVRELLANGIVTRAGYREMHVRVSKAVIEDDRDDWELEDAVRTAATDWSDDIRRFSPDAAIATWMETIRIQFRQSAQQSVSGLGWTKLFQQFDTDGSGEIDQEEFRCVPSPRPPPVCNLFQRPCHPNTRRFQRSEEFCD